MNEERAPSGKSQEPNLNPDQPQVEEFREPSSTGLKIAAVLFVLVAGAAVGYGWLQHNAAQQLASERATLQASLAQSKSQVNALAAEVNALSAAQAKEEAARAQAEALKNNQVSPQASTAPQHVRHSKVVNRAPVDDARWKQFQNQLGDQQKQLTDSQRQIAQTQANLEQAKSELEGNLQSARTELGGDIARNHDEVVALQKKGERNYYEFSFEKSKTFHHTGPISVALRKADAKHEYCDLEMLVDDKTITRKHINLYDAIAFYPEGYPLPLELVINRIDKDSIRGYVSEPKYRSTEKASASVPPPPSAAENPPGPTASDIKLEHRADAEGAH